MNRLPSHPGTEELAEFRAGVTDGARGDQLAAHLAECPECSSASERLGHLPAVLASIPMPAIPLDVESRIMAAITAEGDGRRPTVLSGGHPRTPVPPGGWRPQSLTATVGVMVAAAACLVLAFIGFRLSDQGHPAVTAGSHGRPGQAGGSPVVGGTAAGGIIMPRQNTTSPAIRHPGKGTSFAVLVSSTDFRSATLQAQVTRQLTTPAHPRAANQSQSGPASGLRVAPSKSLVRCVARLDGGAKPTLVEEAFYQSRPAYVIAIPTRAWVVARDCTPARLAVLASVPLSPAR